MAYWMSEEEFSELFLPDGICSSQRIDLRNSFPNRLGKGAFWVYGAGNGVRMHAHTLTTDQDIVIQNTQKKGFYFCNYRIAGHSEVHWNIFGNRTLVFEEGDLTFGYFFGSEIKRFHANSVYSEVIFLIEEETLDGWLAGDHPLKGKMDKKLDSPWKIFEQKKISHYEKILLKRICDTINSHVFNKIDIERDILDLFSQFFSQFPANTPIKKIKKKERNIYLAKGILLKDLAHTPNIKQLAHRAAINECDLKKGFKALFGVTVGEMLRRERLRTAHRLLREGEKDVSTVAHSIGYNSASHFSKIFYAHYGIHPKELKG
ncbi:helix-turn-helix transcriptional regulator [uncultured Desulfuromonas sp.]|uniref:helix-turn-helix transcriptional regulator n=1 Tax=uncultured Desulfuromonas sp. TaxID=181013 RepID=UPI002AAA7043|nr:helix-turn-helix transcriptional regulator [uncultured Desulfuromonas sp.]